MPTIAGGAGPQSLQVAGEDYAKKPVGLSIQALSRFLQDLDYQPPWRHRADEDADYYDSNQYTAEDLRAMEEKGIPPIVVNLIAPTINLMLGMEAKVRQDLVVSAEKDEDVDFASALTRELQIAERATNFDKACSDAYGGQIKTGLHWVHPHRNADPFGYPYVVEPVHRREIWWDWQDLTPELRRARWLIRRKWYDMDVVYHRFPRHEKLIDEIASGWSMVESRVWQEQGQPLYQDWMNERDFYADADTWRNLERKQVMLYEVWYRVPKWGYVLTLPNGVKVEYDRSKAHDFLIAQGKADVTWASMMKMYLSWWAGPHRLVDMPSPLPHDSFPYVPFWGYREDRTGVPYGHIRAMKPLQDEVNARRARMLWQLSARRMLAWDDAFKNKKEAEANVARADSALYLDSEKRRGMRQGLDDMVKIEENLGLNAQQMEAYRDAAQRLQDVANVFMEQLGKGANVDSGIAISQLIEQGTTALAELNENYTFGRKLAGEQLLAFVKHDIGTEERLVKLRPKIGKPRNITLNERKTDERGMVYRNNDVAMTRASLELDAVPASGTFRQFQFKQLSDTVKKLPPELQAPMLDMVVEASDLPTDYKDEISRRIRELVGIDQSLDPEQMSPEEQRAYQEKAQMQDLMKQMEVALQKLTVERADLENRQIDAETEQTEAETEQTKVETAKLENEPPETEEAEDTGTRIPGTRGLPRAAAAG